MIGAPSASACSDTTGKGSVQNRKSWFGPEGHGHRMTRSIACFLIPSVVSLLRSREWIGEPRSVCYARRLGFFVHGRPPRSSSLLCPGRARSCTQAAGISSTAVAGRPQTRSRKPGNAGRGLTKSTCPTKHPRQSVSQEPKQKHLLLSAPSQPPLSLWRHSLVSPPT